MEPKDIASLVVGSLSVCGAAATVYVAKRTLDRQRHMQGWIANHDLLARATGMLIVDHNLLRIYGIDPEEVMKEGITPEELVFIYTNIDAGSALYQIRGDKTVNLTDYRKSFLNNHKVRTAWKKYLRGRTFSVSPFAQSIDEYIAQYESTLEDDRAGRARPD